MQKHKNENQEGGKYFSQHYIQDQIVVVNVQLLTNSRETFYMHSDP